MAFTQTIRIIAWLAVLQCCMLPPLQSQASRPRQTLAISAFGNNSGLPRYDYLGRALADMLTTDFSNSAAIRVVERDRLQELLKELKLSESRFIDPKTAQRVGKGLGASHVVIGSFTVVPPTVRLDARIVRTETSEVSVARSVEGPLVRFLELEKELGRALLQNIDVRLSPQEEVAFQRPVTQSLDALEQYGQALIAKDRGDEVPARSYLEAAAKLDPSFERAKQLLDDLEADIRRVVTREYTDRAVTLLQRNLPDQARQAVDQAIRLNPRDGRAYFLRAVMREKDGQSPVEILSDLDRAITNGHRTPKSYGFRGRVRSTLDDDEGALRDYEAALRVRVDPTVILSAGFDYDDPPDGDETYGRQIFAIGIGLIDLRQPRRAQRSCEVGLDAVADAQFGGPDTAGVRALLSQTDAPRSERERAILLKWAKANLGGVSPRVPDQTWTIFCIGWAIAAEIEEKRDTTLAPIASAVLQIFLNTCFQNNDRSCKSYWPLREYARGALYRLEVQGRIVLDSVIPMPGHDECFSLLDRIRGQGRGSFPEAWTRSCLQEMQGGEEERRIYGGDGRGVLALLRSTPDTADRAVQYLDLLARRLTAVSWDDTPTTVFEVGLKPLITALFDRQRIQEGCKWYAALVEREISTTDLEARARGARCVIPSQRRRATREYLTFSAEIPSVFHTISSPFFRTWLASLQGGATQWAAKDSLRGMLLLSKSEKGAIDNFE